MGTCANGRGKWDGKIFKGRYKAIPVLLFSLLPPLIVQMLRPTLLLASYLLSLPIAHCHGPHPQLQPQWSGWGANIHNDRYIANSAVNSHSISTLTPHCHQAFPYGVSATPALRGNTAYFPTWNGLLVAYDYTTCTIQWQTNITAYLNSYKVPDRYQAAFASPVSRTSPQLDGPTLYIGTLRYALLLAVHVGSGKVLANVQLNPHPLAIATMSPTFHDGRIFIGTSSVEEAATQDVTYACCSFVGNFAAATFDRRQNKFETQWNRTMLPEPYGVELWSGGAIWGSQPAIDEKRGQVFIATGNVYDIPADVQGCIDRTTNDNETACYPDTVWQESVIAFDIGTGKVNWIQRLSALDAWTLACLAPLYGLPPQPTCPPNPGPDADFGMAPSFIPSHSHTTPHNSDIVVVGQKNGFLYALDACNGTIYWSTLTGPDSSSGGALMWGVAVDEGRVYFTAVNPGLAVWTLQPSGMNISNSAFGAIELSTGKFAWEVPVPGNWTSFAPPTVTEDVVLVGVGGFQGAVGTPSTRGSVVALEKGSGKLPKEIAADSVMYGGVAIEGKYAMFGAGYASNYQSPAVGSFNVYQVVGGRGMKGMGKRGAEADPQ
ncbi:hypothetical protein B0A48_05969 [Cryoendolithus antarcticus]|uniref:Pyrrolo-quinoline quinone repeat domain-containing protein n=1 Tax=Cryoendolithus antarcticus TaxID=1507870 RepID=A0A1V8TCU2_9PEZI|nr:hypothetical protein B0A48_05969 [Cryoendolithus antarcticus]